MRHRWIQLFILQLRQTRHFWICSRGGEGLVAAKGLTRHMEAYVAC